MKGPVMFKKILCLLTFLFYSTVFAATNSAEISPEQIQQLQKMQNEIMPVVAQCEASGRADPEETYNCYFDGATPLIANGNVMALLVMIKLSKDMGRNEEAKQWQAYLKDFDYPQETIDALNQAINKLH